MLERKLLFCISINATTLTEALMSMMMTFTLTISHNDNAADDGDNWEDDDDGDVNHDFCYGRTYVIPPTGRFYCPRLLSAGIAKRHCLWCS